MASSEPNSDFEAASDTSTVVYDQEPFETFQARVLQLCQTAFPPLVSGETTLERLRGGGFNRIIGISVIAMESPTPKEYILRIPRFDAAQVKHELAPLKLLHQRGDLAVPEVIAFDTTTKNALGSPYMIQRRLPGTDLFSMFPTMSHETRCALARELGQVFSTLHSIQSNIAGNLRLSPSGESLMIQPFHNTEGSAASAYLIGPSTQTTVDMLFAALEYKKRLAAANGSDDALRVEFFTSFITVAREMSALGLLDQNNYCLCHLDLEPRNILVQALSSAQAHVISGILDWDSAIFGPLFMSCSPPMWLWAWIEGEDEDERFANDIPATLEQRQLKNLFEDAAGETYARFAYAAQYRLGRRLVRFAIDGLRSNEDFVNADLYLQE
ncbi:hypothetical protein ACEPPN_008161 [Leptodophora sp. 'Broadleaf-Isolate-01']